MKKFLVKLSFFIVSYTVLFSVYVFSTGDDQSYFAAIIDKHVQLKKITQPKLVIVGGSNCAFSINSKELEDSLNLQVYNSAITYFFGMDFMLTDIEPYLKSGDIVLLVPEYEMFYGDQLNGNVGLYTMLTAHPAGLTNLNGTQIAEFPKNMFVVGTERLKGYFNTKSTFKSDVYARHSFNEKGDMTAHLRSKPSHMTFKKVIIPGSFNPESIGRLQDFISARENENVKVWISFPSLAMSAKNEEYTREVEDSLSKYFPSHLISRTEDYFFADSLFFDDYYHLAAKGREARTEILIRDIKAKMEVK